MHNTHLKPQILEDIDPIQAKATAETLSINLA